MLAVEGGRELTEVHLESESPTIPSHATIISAQLSLNTQLTLPYSIITSTEVLADLDGAISKISIRTPRSDLYLIQVEILGLEFDQPGLRSNTSKSHEDQ
ncbi:hypothetical protein QCA50_013257 [Cerrena zonata]|uniref:Uncharacterized protein n=1 Tax=Cerrena zonata TaxID=2478898 RepID=A0AAW0FRE7_9APHY